MRKTFLSLVGVVGMSFFACFACFAPRTLAADGIFADFDTSLGNFTVTLDFTNAPQTVANFIGLATGEHAWMDWKTGQVRTNPFYNGLTFHRVISNFVIQAGSPNGSGTDGPGYVIKDEISPLLKHSKTGVIAMAKSSSPIAANYLTPHTWPHSGSSQFYITLSTDTSYLDGIYSVFGVVSSNLNAVLAIGRVATDNSSKPVTPVVINSVTIRRVGTAAQAFNAQNQPLPLVQKVESQPAYSNQQFSFTLNNNFPYALTRVFESTNLAEWSVTEKGFDLAPPLMTNIVQAATNPLSFYNLTRVQYPSSSWAPRSLYGQSLTLKYDYYYATTLCHVTNRIDFDNSGSAFYQTVPTSLGTSDSYYYFQDIYRGFLYPIYFSSLETMQLELNFTNETGGNLFGSAYEHWTGYPMYDLVGTFSLGPSVIPGAPSLISPAEGAIVSNFTPQFTWSQSTGATWYYWALYRNDTNYQSQWIEATNCSAKSALPPGTYYWYAQGYNSGVYGFYSPWGSFIVPPLAVSPSGTNIAAGAKDYVWIADPLADWYNVEIYKGAATFANLWFRASELTPVDPGRVWAHVATSHTSGSYSWRVCSMRAGVTGSWSPVVSFTIP